MNMSEKSTYVSFQVAFKGKSEHKNGNSVILYSSFGFSDLIFSFLFETQRKYKVIHTAKLRERQAHFNSTYYTLKKGGLIGF